ncbi:DUF3472 domain-containing protein [Psychrobium sp. 1_MG-2023]|uniref:DUF3472 domain-containing protein n=1 Tax=Psychrobium sp. 1_MG-2023 TaxID=3062624 RepID=UPI00273585B7|nr:DUF3472 domain-containing protein [Psychrobium sp. 1_MG-2023]MDP2560748.1 DUF3472 domain-containing protein [Psychrobium sp. 1_MG-2023]
MLKKQLSILLAIGLMGCSGAENNKQAKSSQPAVSEQTTTVVVPNELSVNVAIAGNSWIVNSPEKTANLIGDKGLTNWSDSNDEIVTYVYFTQVGELAIGLQGFVESGLSEVEVTLGSESKIVEFNNTTSEQIYAGNFNVGSVGYHAITIKGLSSEAQSFANISDVLLGGSAAKGQLFYVKEDFYWGRRGPSVHLGYQVEDPSKDYQWFYSELEVASGQDIIGSYFMANGFAEGYFGIQVNSETERRVLFSVWSPHVTDDPSTIPEDKRIKLLDKGEEVYSGKFGNEGSGGQSYLVYDWLADTRYQFLLKVSPVSGTNTDYTAFFKAESDQAWQLIAKFRRPQTSTYIKRPHSFLENFLTEMGNQERAAQYTNQWLRDTEGQWHELTKATFTYDATARKRSRLDYQGGVVGNEFFLRNGGFFTGNTELGTQLERPSNNALSITLPQSP